MHEINVTFEDPEVIDITFNPAEELTVQFSDGPPGLPTGGTAGQVLSKASNNNYEVQWSDASAPGPHTHDVEDINATGTADATTYLRGDGTWSTPAGGGGASNWGELGGTLSDQTDLQSALDAKADDADLTNLVDTTDPRLSDARTPTAHTHASTEVTDFNTAVDDRIQNIVGAAPAALDTLGELANALGDDADFAGTVTTSLAGKSNVDHTHVKADVGLANVDNTSDLDKPVSTATQTALDDKADTTTTDDLAADITDLQTNKADDNSRYWNGTGGSGTWDARPSLPAGKHAEAYSVLDPDAPAPPDSIAGDIWNRHPDAPDVI